MNKTKRQLFEENKKLKEEKKLHKDFWEVDIYKEQQKQINFAKRTLFVLAFVFLLLSVFLMGMMWQ